MNLNDRSADMPCFRVPTNVITDLESVCHAIYKTPRKGLNEFINLRILQITKKNKPRKGYKLYLSDKADNYLSKKAYDLPEIKRGERLNFEVD